MNLQTKSLAAVIILGLGLSSRALAVTPYVTPLLIINDSDPSAVTFTYTDYDPFRSDDVHTFSDGIDLENFFAPNSDEEMYFDNTSGNLTTFLDGTPDYNYSHSDDATGSYTEPIIVGDPNSGETVDFQDLNIYSSVDEDNPTENFSTGSQAFTGVATIDLSSEIGNLLPAGTIGAIYAGYSGDLPSNDIESLSEFTSLDTSNGLGDTYLMYLGDYEIVPEPSQWTLLLLGAAGLIAVRRFKTLHR